jgi:2-polyprenyl-3-methyl-5-hydroxy-6-metoxy-1,4-benzoquinol methylase
MDREVSDPAEAAAVRAGWLLIDAHERMSIRGAERVFGHELAAWHDYANETIVTLEHPEGTESMQVLEGKNNILRYRRTVDFARPGDRVFDVGFGRGYLAAQLIRERKVASYHGIDIEMSNKPHADALFAANDLVGAAIHLEHGDLFELTRDQVEATGATLMICCEVLEHVPDAELGLRRLAEVLPDGADLVFSVPLHGRLESVWGHLSVFDVARLKEMLDGAGLYAHHVEPLSNTWSLVVASNSPEPSQRVREATRRPPVRSSVALTGNRVFVDVSADDMSVSSRSAEGAVSLERAGDRRVSCRLSGDGGIAFPVNGLEAMRLWIGFTDVAHVRSFVVRAYVDGEQATMWNWKPVPRQIEGFTARRFALRPGESSVFAGGNHQDLDKVDRVEVIAKVAPGHQAEFGLRVAYLP